MNRIKLSLATLFALMPMAAFAMGCQGEHEASACAHGLVWDDEAQACVETVSS